MTIANPAATILSGAMMLSYLGESASAQRLIDATLETIRSEAARFLLREILVAASVAGGSDSPWSF